MAPDTLSLAGKVAIITGSGRENGIGGRIAQTLALNGAAVTINYVSENSTSRAEEVAQSIHDLGARAAVIRGSIETQEGASKIVSDTMEAFGVIHIDILVNNAGVGSVHFLTEMTPELLQNHFGINVFGTLYMTQAVVTLGKMPRGGRIINVGSCASKMGVGDGMGVYGATKAASDYLTASWAWQLGRSHGITINSIGPGPVDTDIIGDGVAHVSDPSIHKDLFITPFVNLTRAEERVGTTDDVADAVLLLVNEKSRWITGQFISVSGGINVM